MLNDYETKLEEGLLRPQNSFQQLIAQYKATGENKYFLRFLHRYEPHINKVSREAATYYAVAEHWQDLKSEIIATLWDAVQSYDPSCNVDFLVSVQRKIARSIHNYIRTMRSGFSVHSEGEYKRLRSIMAEYRSKSLQDQPIDTEEMARRWGISEALLIEILQGAFRNTTLLPQHWENDEGSEEDLRQNAAS